MNLKEVWKKFWFILWKDDSLKGWILSVIFVFIFIKFIFFPILSLVTGTVLPLAIVESCSMYHDGNILSNFDNWWVAQESKYSQFDIEKQDFDNFKKGFNKGDILFVLGAKPEKLEVGDVIIFSANQRNPVIHRIVDINENEGELTFSTIGDNNNGQLSFENNIKSNQIVGRASFRLAPYVGWIKLLFFEYQKNPLERGLCN